MRTSRSTLTAAFLLLGGCGDVVTAPDPSPVETRILSGDDQVRFPESVLVEDLWVQAYDDLGAPLKRAGMAVTWTVSSGGGSLALMDASTNSEGSARGLWRLGTTPGDQTLAVSVEGTPAATFSARAVEPGPILFTHVGTGAPGTPVEGIYSVNADGSDLILVRRGKFQNAFRSPDGGAVIMGRRLNDLERLRGGQPSPVLVSLPALVPAEFPYQNTRALDFDWSPDGSQVSFYLWQIVSNDCHERRIWVAQADGTSLTQLSNGAPCTNERNSDWSSDGSKLVFQSAGGGDFANAAIWTMGSDGSNPARVVGSGLGHRPRWLPDGRRVVVGGYERGGLNSIRIVDTVTGDQEIVWSPDGLITVLPGGISPDGRFAVVEATFEGESSDIYTIDLTTGDAFNVTNRPDVDDYFPSWWSGAP